MAATTGKESNWSHRVSQALKAIYAEHSPPDRLQSDRGSEFEGRVRLLRKALKIKLIKSRSYHPQSQGKVERSHRIIEKKDYVPLGNSGEEGS